MISKSWQADLKSLSSIQAFIEGLGKDAGFTSQRISQINIAVEELVVNIINHAFEDNQGETITIEVQEDPDKIAFRIIDSGIPFDPLKVKDPDITLDLMDRPIGGLGIFLVKQFASQVDYVRRGNNNILTMMIHKKE